MHMLGKQPLSRQIRLATNPVMSHPGCCITFCTAASGAGGTVVSVSELQATAMVTPTPTAQRSPKDLEGGNSLRNRKGLAPLRHMGRLSQPSSVMQHCPAHPADYPLPINGPRKKLHSAFQAMVHIRLTVREHRMFCNV